MKNISLNIVQNIFGYGVGSADIFEDTFKNEKLGISFTEKRVLIKFIDSQPDECLPLADLLTLCKKMVSRVSPWTLQSYVNQSGSGICRVKVGDGQEIFKSISPEGELSAVVLATEWVIENKRKG